MPERTCRLSPNAVTEVLEEMGVWVDERDINGWRVGRLRLQFAGGIGYAGGYLVHSVNGPDVRSRIAYTKADIRELCRDFFPRRRNRRDPLYGRRMAPDRFIRPRCIGANDEQR
jgi:hypothetical protein